MSAGALALPSVSAGAECALCGETMLQGDSVVRCPVCETYYHADCWAFAYGRCARLGCSGRAVTSPAIEQAVPASPRRPGASLLRIEPEDIAAAKPQQSPPQAPDMVIGMWATVPLATLGGGLLGLLLGSTFHLTEIVLRWGMGQQRFDQASGLHLLSSATQASWWWWLLGGAAYAVLHRGYLLGHGRTLYPQLRVLLVASLSGSLSPALGHLVFLPSYRWPTFLWGAPEGVAWLAPVFAWSFLGVSLGMALYNYSKALSLFAQAAALCALAVALALNANSSAWAYGIFGHYAGWLVGSVADWLWHGHDLKARISGGLLVAFANVGFVAGSVGLFRSRQKRARRRG